LAAAAAPRPPPPPSASAPASSPPPRCSGHPATTTAAAASEHDRRRACPVQCVRACGASREWSGLWFCRRRRRWVRGVMARAGLGLLQLFCSVPFRPRPREVRLKTRRSHEKTNPYGSKRRKNPYKTIGYIWGYLALMSHQCFSRFCYYYTRITSSNWLILAILYTDFFIKKINYIPAKGTRTIYVISTILKYY
jgi:hypothetical protein